MVAVYQGIPHYYLSPPIFKRKLGITLILNLLTCFFSLIVHIICLSHHICSLLYLSKSLIFAVLECKWLIVSTTPKENYLFIVTTILKQKLVYFGTILSLFSVFFLSIIQLFQKYFLILISLIFNLLASRTYAFPFILGQHH